MNRTLLRDRDGQAALETLFEWLIMHTKEKTHFQVVLSSSDSFFTLWVEKFIGPTMYNTYVFGHLDKAETLRYWNILLKKNDYYSRFMEVQKLNTTTSSSVVTHLKSIFARFGIPTTMISDNGPQFDSQEMKEFSQSYGFQHVTTSPYYPQANGLAERTVKTVKRLLEHSSDPYRALLSYRATLIPWCALSPAELLMRRKIRTDVPQSKDNLIPKWSHIKNFRSLDKGYKESQKKNYD